MLKIQYNDPELVNLELRNIVPYLKANNWQLIRSEPFFVFEGRKDDDGNLIKIVLPKSDDREDILRRVADAINLISKLERKTPYEIIKVINSFDKDVIFIKLETSSISLTQAASFIEKIKNFWTLAASSEENPQPFLSKSLNIGMDYADKCVFGHTIKGSFGFTIESPISPRPLPQSTLDGGEIEQIPPFERRVIERISRGIKNTQDAVAEGNVNILINNYKRGLNANTCDKLSEILEEFHEIKTEYSVSWSPIWTSQSDITNVKIILDSKAPAFLKSAAKSLKKENEIQIVDIIGKVIELKYILDMRDEEDSSDDNSIVILDDAGRRVHVQLSDTDYRLACDAHRDKIAIIISGTLEKRGKFWHLLAPHDFKHLMVEKND